MKLLTTLFTTLTISLLGFCQTSSPLIIKENKTLYRKTGNSLTILNTNSKELTFKTIGAEVIQTQDSGTIIIYPYDNTDTVKLSIFNLKNKIAELLYLVIETPTPKIDIQWKANHNLCPTKISIKAKITNKYYVTNFPKDSKLKVTKGTVKLIRKNRQINQQYPINSSKVNISTLSKVAQKGDTLLTHITEVQRLTYTNKVEIISLDETTSIEL